MDLVRIIEQAEILLKKEDGNGISLAKKLGFSSRYIADIKAGKSKNPSPAFILSLINILNFNPVWLETGRGEMLKRTLLAHEVAHLTAVKRVQEGLIENASKIDDGYKIPVLYQKVSCGQGQNWEDEQNIMEYADLFTMIPRKMEGRLYALRAQGSSMLGAGIQEGDYVIFSTQPDQIVRDGNYIISLDGDLFCKRLEYDGFSEKLRIYSVRVADLDKAELEKTIKKSEMNDRLHILGRVIGWVHPDLKNQ